MIIRINGKEETVGQAKTLADLLAGRKLAPERVVVEHNLAIVPKEDLGKTFLKDQDAVEIVSFVGGG